MPSNERRGPIFLVVGARPNFVKAAALYRAFRRRRLAVEICHTGQHYDEAMSGSFFRLLGLPRPKHALGVGSGSHAEQTGAAMVGIERALERSRPAIAVVVGDVNSTAAGALAAAKLNVPVAHVEAGLRSGDRSMPEEINRIVTDSVADYFFVTERAAIDNLRREGVPAGRIFFSGNVMIDTLRRFAPRAAELGRARALGLPEGGFALATLHRPANVDSRPALTGIVRALRGLGERLPVALCAHPRTTGRLKRFGLIDRFGAVARGRPPRALENGLWLLPPQGYLEFLSLLLACRLVLTDSGGLQEETSALGIPCLTLRPNTERPVTLTRGTSRLVGSDPGRILAAAGRALRATRTAPRIPRWDGRAGDRIAAVLAGLLRKRGG